VPSSVGKSASELVRDALKVTERVRESDITSSARYAENRDVMLNEIEAAAEDEEEDEVVDTVKLGELSAASKSPPGGYSGSWEDMFAGAVEDAPLAVVLCDMNMPGLPLTFVNKAFEQLTGYSKTEAEGTNCRMLQGQHTEQDQVAAIIRALQRAEPCQLTLTNYKKGGVEFQNLFSMKPVHDSDGVYRYTIGVQCEVNGGGATKAQTKALKATMKQLPSSFESSLQPLAELTQEEKQSAAARSAQLKSAMMQFSKLVWMADAASTLPRLVEREDFCNAYMKFMKAEYSEGQLQMVLGAQQVDQMPSGPGQEAQAKKVWEEYVAPTGKQLGAGSAVDQVREEASATIRAMGEDTFPRFVQTKECDAIVDAVVGSGGANSRRSDLIWKKYKVPVDVAEWIYAFAGAAETYPACIVISDMAIAGNPMVYVNQEFCKVTGYAKHEATGRNCRFLQGPRTEPASVAVIQDTLRRGVDCHVRITNYRKSGDTFQNLLSMRPVHDSHGVYRFCIGVQFEVSQNAMLKERLKKLDALLQLLPETIEVQTRKPSGRKYKLHEKDPVPSSVGKSASELVSAALKVTERVRESDITSSARYAENRDVMLEELAAD